MNTSSADMDIVGERSSFVFAKTEAAGGSGTSAPATAVGVFNGLRAAVAHAFGDDDLGGRVVAVQGVGAVGEPLARELAEHGAHLVVTDVDDVRAKELAQELDAETAGTEEIVRRRVRRVRAVRDRRRVVGGDDPPAPLSRGGGRSEQPARRARGRGPARRARHPVRARLRRQRRRHDPPRVTRAARRGRGRARRPPARHRRHPRRGVRARRAARDLDRRRPPTRSWRNAWPRARA